MNQTLQPIVEHKLAPNLAATLQGGSNAGWMIDQLVPLVIQAHPDVLTPAAMEAAQGKLRIAMMEVAADPKSRLHECTPQSWVVAMAKSAASGLFPGGPQPQAYLIKRGKEVHWQMAWRGAVDLAHRAGWRIWTELVYKGDEFEYVLGEQPRIVKHIPGPRDFDDSDPSQEWEAMTHGYVVVEEIATGWRGRAVLSRGAIEKRRARSEAWKSDPKGSPWGQWPGELTRATLIKYGQTRRLFPREVLAGAAAADLITAATLPTTTDLQASTFVGGTLTAGYSPAAAAIADATPLTDEEMRAIEDAERQEGGEA